MDIKERFKKGFEGNHIANEHTIQNWGYYMNGKKINLGDQIWYSFHYSNKNDDEVELYLVNLNDLDDYVVNESKLFNGTSSCSIPILKSKTPNKEILLKIKKYREQNG